MSLRLKERARFLIRPLRTAHEKSKRKQAHNTAHHFHVVLLIDDKVGDVVEPKEEKLITFSFDETQ